MASRHEKSSIYDSIFGKRETPSLVDLCVNTAIDNLRYLGDVGETDLHLLDRILPHCTVDQLVHVEKSSEGRDLSPVTDKLWKKFYEKQFGTNSTDLVLQRMRQKKVAFKWLQLYEAKLKDAADAEKKAVDRLKKLYQKEVARKQSRQIQICSKVPPSSNKRSFYGNGYNVSNLKSNIMKKAKIETLKSQEVKNLTAMKKIAMQKNHSVPSMMKPGRMIGKDSSASSSKIAAKPVERRY